MITMLYAENTRINASVQITARLLENTERGIILVNQNLPR
ncbi:hypothetical protein C7434_2314 [Pantoea sp. PNA 14-12]|nr:hypothetical protein C7434_2314 [Pantoea sp. PNA 14-12]